MPKHLKPVPDPILPPAVGPLIPWLQTAAFAVLGAFLIGALELALAMLTGATPGDPFTREGLAHVGRTGLGAALVVALAYLKRSPLPRREWSEDERAHERARLASQGRLK